MGTVVSILWLRKLCLRDANPLAQEHRVVRGGPRFISEFVKAYGNFSASRLGHLGLREAKAETNAKLTDRDKARARGNAKPNENSQPLQLLLTRNKLYLKHGNEMNE